MIPKGTNDYKNRYDKVYTAQLVKKSPAKDLDKSPLSSP